MPRRYRLSIIALIGLALGPLASYPNCEAQTKQSDPKEAAQNIQPPAASVQVEEVKEGPEYYKPCGSGESDRKSDLCAQWKAADAAQVSAYWTWVSTVTGILGAFISAVTLVAASAAAVFAKRAADHTKDGVFEAKRSAKAAEESLIASERPWIKVDAKITKDITFPLDGNGRQQASITVDFTVLNFGKSPALDVVIYWKILPDRWSASDLRSEFKEELESRKRGAKVGYTIFPGDSRTDPYELSIAPDDIERTMIAKRWREDDDGIAPDILCCVVYVNTRTGIHHETGMVFHISRIWPYPTSLDLSETCPAENISVDSAVVGGYVS